MIGALPRNISLPDLSHPHDTLMKIFSMTRTWARSLRNSSLSCGRAIITYRVELNRALNRYCAVALILESILLNLVAEKALQQTLG
jgi:hypothetical protein